MHGMARGMMVVGNVLVGCRVASKHMTYIPAFVGVSGERFSPRLAMPVIEDFEEDGRAIWRTLFAKGMLATVLAKHCPNGKKLSVEVDDDNFIQRLIWDNDSRLTLHKEIIQGKRPQYWDVPQHPDWMAWRHLCNEKRLTVFSDEHIRSRRFFHAKVKLPKQMNLNNASRFLASYHKII